MNQMVTRMQISEVINQYPYAKDFLAAVGMPEVDGSKNMEELITGIPDRLIEDSGISREQLLQHFNTFIGKMGKGTSNTVVDSVTILGGRDKSGNEEGVNLTVRRGDIACIVGPTGSGKSRLLADIECLAQKDTPTGRQVLVNGQIPNESRRFSVENKLVAQLSQNMNYVMDLTVKDFIAMHAESRMIGNSAGIVREIADCANELAGESFSDEVPVTQLSGGQSRALMIADAALLSASPIVLIDEIENAGVDRKKALELLVKKEKIVLMSTHDPILALMGDKRIVIKNGGISKVINTGDEEKTNLMILQAIDAKMVTLRNKIRSGDVIYFDVYDFLIK